MSSFLERYREALRLRNMKQADLSRLAGFPSASLSQWNTGRNRPSSDSIIVLAKALNVSPEWLMGEDVPMERSGFEMISPDVLSEDEVVTFPILGHAQVSTTLDIYTDISRERKKAVSDKFRRVKYE